MRPGQLPKVSGDATELTDDLNRAATRPTRAATRPARPAAPIVLDRYRLHRRLGSGAFGTVWLARDERLEREVAIKIVPRERIVDGRFEREARAAARLAHPAIVTLYEAAVDDDDAYLVSELVRGTTLDRLLADGRLSDRAIVQVGVALCGALGHAHSQGVVHRDVKPSNVLVPEAPSTLAQAAKLTDFGVARVVGGDSLTRTGDVIGTAAYMAPEQAEGRQVGPSADLYSLALVIYESLTGVNPVRTESTARIRRLAVHLPPLRRQRRELPHELGHGIDLALRPRPRERGTVEELQGALEAALGLVGDTPGVVASPWPVRRTVTEGRPAPDRRLTEPPTPPRPPTPPTPPTPAVQTDDHAARDEPPGRKAAGESWPTRATAAAATAVLTAWLAAHLLTPSPIAPVAAAVCACGLALAFPRVGFLSVAMAFVVAAVAQHHPGIALVIATGALLTIIPLVRAPGTWPLPAAAPALGAIALAGAWPALASTAGTARRRAALGAGGWLWLLLAGPLAGSDLYLRRPGSMPTPRVWSSSTYHALHHVLEPLLNAPLLAPAAIWAAAAVILPWLVRGRFLALDVVRVAIWAAIVASATSGLVTQAHRTLQPGVMVLGALGGALVALAPVAARGWRTSRYSRDSSARFA